MKSRALVLFLAILGILLVLSLGFGLHSLFESSIQEGWRMSLLLLAVFLPILFFARGKGKKNAIGMVLFMSMIAGFINLSGNEIYNAPLQWLLSGKGQLYESVQIMRPQPGTTAVSMSLYLKDVEGMVTQLPFLATYLYRFVQYYIMLSLLSALILKIPVKNNPIPPLPEAAGEVGLQLRDEIIGYLKEGKKIAAIKHVRERMTLSLLDAKLMVEDIEKQENIS